MISILVPASRLEPQFLGATLRSIMAQECEKRFEVIVGVRSDRVDEAARMAPGCRIVGTSGTQAASCNIAADVACGDYLAIMHDDDIWHPLFLHHSVAALKKVDFVASAQLANREWDRWQFPIPPTWMMTREVWDTVGPFDESYISHLDCEWLCRLNKLTYERGQLSPRYGEGRMPLVVQHRFLCHAGPPLVTHRVHVGSDAERIKAGDPVYRERSRREHERLAARYGVPTRW